jgi:hypothetical protein
MKNLFLILLVVPFLSFGQITEKKKKAIDNYANEICGCVNTVITDLHPKMFESFIYLAENGQEKFPAHIQNVLSEMTDEEKQAYMASFQKIQEPAFGAKIDNCDKSSGITEELKKETDDLTSDTHKYLMEYLGKETSCKILKVLYDMGSGK